MNDRPPQPPKAAPTLRRRGWNKLRQITGMLRRRDTDAETVSNGDGVISLEGPYACWEDAAARAQGYDSGAVFQGVTRSALAVRDGIAIAERDGVTFQAPQIPHELLVALRTVEARSERGLRVLDFGGALGSTYYQCRDHLVNRELLSWVVIEQQHFVEFGQREMSTPQLSFASDLQAVLNTKQFDVAVFSGVLQVIPDPFAILRVTASFVPAVIIDRTSVSEQAEDLFAVQHVPAFIYGVRASYPVRVFARTNLIRQVTSLWGAPAAVGPAAYDPPLTLAKHTVNFVSMFVSRGL